MWRIGILIKEGNSIAETFNTKSECEDWLLLQAEKCAIKKAIIVNKENIKDREIITDF